MGIEWVPVTPETPATPEISKPKRRGSYPRALNNMGIMEIGYKVVRSTSEGRFPTHIGQSVNYTPGKVITPPEGFGPLAVFTTLEAAKGFCGASTRQQVLAIYEVAYVPSKEESYWKRGYSGRRVSMSLKHAPKGKAAATSLIMLKLVYVAPLGVGGSGWPYNLPRDKSMEDHRAYVRAHNALVDEHPEFIPEFGPRIEFGIRMKP